MKIRLFTLPVSAVLAAGLMLGQTAGSGGSQTNGGYAHHGGGMFQSLNLSDAQKEQAKAIFSASREANRALEQQMRDARQALNTAVKNGATDAQIDQLAVPIGPLSSQLAAAQAKTFAKFYAILTPEQKAQVGDHMFARSGRAGWHRANPNNNQQ